MPSPSSSARHSNVPAPVEAGFGREPAADSPVPRAPVGSGPGTSSRRLPAGLLASGDRLSQREFHRRYLSAPESVKAELIGGIVYVAPPPLGSSHGRGTFKTSTILDLYEAATPGVEGHENTTTILGEESEPQPDLSLRLLRDCGGRSRINRGGFLVGPPELVIEVAYSSASIDLHAKKEEYRRHGVQEYLVLCLKERRLVGFDLVLDVLMSPGKDGIVRSQVFPGLWIDPAAVLKGDTRRACDVLRRGLRSAAHAAFVRRLRGFRQAAGRRRPRK